MKLTEIISVLKKFTPLSPLVFIFCFSINYTVAQQNQKVPPEKRDPIFQHCQKIIFNDDLSHAEVGKPDTNWETLQSNQVVKTVAGVQALSFEGDSFCVLKPKSLRENYLSNEFTIEFDLHSMNNTTLGEPDSGLIIYLNSQMNRDQAMILVSDNSAVYAYPDTKKFYADPKLAWTSGDVDTENSFFPKPNEKSLYGRLVPKEKPIWEHVTILYSGMHLKVYVAYTLALDVANTQISPVNFLVGTYCSVSNPLSIKNFKVAIHEPSEEIKNLLANGKIITHAITFDNNSSTIKSESISFISDIADVLKRNPDIMIAINGYTDNSGSSKDNLDLSYRRARAVKNELTLSMGILPSRILVKGFGESNPIGDNKTESGKAENRRIEFQILK